MELEPIADSSPQPILLPAAAVSKCFIACPPSPDAVPTLWGTPIVSDDASVDISTESEHISLCHHLLHRAQCQLESAFLRIQHQSTVSAPRRPQATVICSPHSDCTEAVDAAVVFLAHRLRADVVILDSADLAEGCSGVFGSAFTTALWNIHDESASNDSDSQVGSCGSQCIEALVRVRPDTIKPSDRRLLYLRDFGTLVNSAIVSAIAKCASQSPNVLVVAGTAPVNAAPSKAPTTSASPARSAEHTRHMRGLNNCSLPHVQKLYAMSLHDATKLRGEVHCVEDLYTALFAARYLGSTFLAPEGRSDSEESSSDDDMPSLGRMLFSGIMGRKGSTKKPDPMQLTKNERKAMDKANLDIATVIRVALARELPRALRDRFEVARRRRFIGTNLHMLGWSLSALGKSLRAPTDEEWRKLLQEGPDFLDGIGMRMYSKEQREEIAEMLPHAASVHDISPTLERLARGKAEWRRQVKLGTEGWFCDPIVEQVKVDGDLTKQERGLLSCIVDPASVNTTFADVHIPKSTIDALRTVVTLPLVAPSAYSKGILSSESGAGVLLYGPPGTGKTMACRALVQESRVRMLQIQASTIMRCYVGQSEEMVTAIFSLARKLGPCIVFIDELDAIFGCRNEKTPIWHTSVLTEFMQEMDGLRTADINRRKGVIVVGATNRPQDLDYAVIRRLPRRILVDLPGIYERQSILEHYLREEERDESVDLKTLAVKTTLFSGSDLRDLVLAATLNAVKSALPEGWQNNKGMRDPLQDTPRTLRADHFTQALKEISASCATDMSGLEQVRQWSRTGRGRAAGEASVRVEQRRVGHAIPIPIQADWMCE